MSPCLENSALVTGLEKFNFHSNPKERKCQRMFKLWHNCTHLTSFSKLDFNSMLTKNFQMFKLVLEKAEEPEIKLPTSVASLKKYEFQKTSFALLSSALLTMPKPLTVWITTNCGKFLERWEYQTILPAS